MLQRLYPSFVWKIPNNEQAVFLTFDDGPHPEITPKVLALLKQYHAKATFFCVGENAQKHPEIIKQIAEEGHALGNHTHNHLHGFKTPLEKYIENTEECAEHIFSTLFRPPYGKITRKQGKALMKKGYNIVMWNVLSYDFDKTLSPQRCAENVANHLKPGAIVIFHDSAKAEKNMLYALEKTLTFCAEKKIGCKTIVF
ncbi:MAG: polysaccharide deacetylase family protein [Bacteroidia bacterium]